MDYQNLFWRIKRQFPLSLTQVSLPVYASFISHKSTQKSRHKEKMKTFLLRQFFWCWTWKHTKKKNMSILLLHFKSGSRFLHSSNLSCVSTRLPPMSLPILSHGPMSWPTPSWTESSATMPSNTLFSSFIWPTISFSGCKNLHQRNKLWVPKIKSTRKRLAKLRQPLL